jgi:hypothetical protein
LFGLFCLLCNCVSSSLDSNRDSTLTHTHHRNHKKRSLSPLSLDCYCHIELSPRSLLSPLSLLSPRSPLSHHCLTNCYHCHHCHHTLCPVLTSVKYVVESEVSRP